MPTGGTMFLSTIGLAFVESIPLFVNQHAAVEKLLCQRPHVFMAKRSFFATLPGFRVLRIALVLHLFPFNVLYHASDVTCQSA